MAQHLNPLEKEFLIQRYLRNPKITMKVYCINNNISETSFRKWLKQYQAGGIEGLARADSESPDILPEGVDRTEEAYKREILKLRIEMERLKKNYMVRTKEDGTQEYIRLKPKNLK